MPNLRGWEIFILLAIVLLLFGSKKLPDAARGIGRSLRIFKAETKGLMDDDQSQAVNSAERPAVENSAADTTVESATRVNDADKSPSSGPSST